VLAASPRNLVVRTMWVWGEGQGAKQTFPDFVRGRLAAGGPLRAVTDQWGNPTRAADLATAIWKIAAGAPAGRYPGHGALRVKRRGRTRAGGHRPVGQSHTGRGPGDGHLETRGRRARRRVPRRRRRPDDALRVGAPRRGSPRSGRRAHRARHDGSPRPARAAP